MRITFVLPGADLSGGVRAAAVHARGLKQRGHEVLVVYPPPSRPGMKQRLVSLARGRPLPEARHRDSHLDGSGLQCHVLNRHRPVHASDVPDADIIVASWWQTAEWIAAMPAAKGAKAYFIQHDETLWFPDDPAWVRAVAATWKLPMHKIAVSRWIIDTIRQKSGVANIELVPNGVDLDQFNVPERAMQPHPTVGLMYSANPFKGVDIALAAYQLARQRIPSLRLVCFGTHEPVPSLPLPAGASFHRAPPQEQIRTLYALCDSWLFASRAEGFGLPILEAMACRTPVIAAPAGAATELLADGGGILVDPESPTSMAAAITRIAAMTAPEWAALSTRALQTARQHTWRHATEAFESALIHATPFPAKSSRYSVLSTQH